MPEPLSFEIFHRCRSTAARVGRVTTPHGSFDTPAFMPVGTKASVKGLLPPLVEATGAQIILNNTYHLMLRPGTPLIESLGGVHGFMKWNRPILTDSGGFQVFSLADIRKIDDAGVTFRSEVDGAEVRLTPEASIKAQNQIGADIIMAFDDCPPANVEEVASRQTLGRHAVSADQYAQRNATAVQRTIAWMERCIAAHGRKSDQALFTIVQGGTDLELRTACATALVEMDCPGYAIGGVAVGEGHEHMMRVVGHTAPLLPEGKPRYLMGVGYERDIVEAVKRGVDMFDCVLPTRNGRNANAFTPTGAMRLKNAQYTADKRPIDESCDCTSCAGGYSRAYLRHLFLAGEMLGPILVSLHNLRHFQRLMLDIRRAIRDDGWSFLRQHWPVIEAPVAAEDGDDNAPS